MYRIASSLFLVNSCGKKTPVLHINVVIMRNASLSQMFIDPIAELRHAGVHSGNARFTTANTPRDDSSLIEAVHRSGDGANQRRSTVTLAGVLTSLTASTHEALVQVESLAQPGGPQRRLAVVERHDGQFDLLQDDLVLAIFAKYVLTPAGREATVKVKVVVLGRKADRVDGVDQFGRFVQEEQGHIVVQAALVELLVVDDLDDVAILMVVNFVGGLRVPLTKSNLNLRGFLVLDAMRRGQYNLGMDQRTAALIHVNDLVQRLLLLQNCHHPRELTVLGLTVAVTGDAESNTVGVTVTTAGLFRCRTGSSVLTCRILK